MVTLNIFHYTDCFVVVTVAERNVHVKRVAVGDERPGAPSPDAADNCAHANLHNVRLVAFMANEVAFNGTDVAAPQTKMSRYSRQAGKVNTTDGTPVYKHHPQNNVLSCRRISSLQHLMKMTVKHVQYSDLLAIFQIS